MNYILLLIGAGLFILMSLDKAKKRNDFNMAVFISRNWVAFLINLLLGGWLILSDGVILAPIIDKVGNSVFVLAGLTGSIIIKFIYDFVLRYVSNFLNKFNKP